ncbi:FERM domain-containing protein 4A-like isoform X4 [Haliotis rufescens]|uniref:FERM domain-containing protein 4A-like isoform X4 n=1 Tax=Haliotis rufescens TaxID=6454 RepID=UPI00201EFFFF|nr:FERM domain-containing protein 4A-like isoform X4 [Haliotis rufescens]
MSLKERRVAFCEDPEIKSAREARSRTRNQSHARRAKSQEVRSRRDRSMSQDKPRKRQRSLVSLVRTGSRSSVRNLVRLFENKLMTEGRKSQIVLMDERRLDIIIQPKLFTRELLDLVSSHFKLKEKQYFGLAFVDDTHHFNWLNLDKRVLDHDFGKKTGALILHFSISYYIETIGLLRDSATVELFYLNARQAVFKGQIETDSETIFELAAHVLQATHGDFVSDEDTKSELKKLPVIPTSSLKEHPSIAFCEDRILCYYQKLQGTSRGLAIVNYMNIVERLPTYGIHYYEVKDKKDIPWWLGISPKGISVFDKNDKTTPRKLFTWKQLENLYYRDKKFSIEVHDPKRVIHTLSSFNLYEDAIREPLTEFDDLSDAISDPSTQVSVSRRTFGPGNVNVHAWFAATHQLTKCVWQMAVAQHQFYLDRKQSKATLPSARSMSEIAADLSKSTTSLPGSVGSDLSRSASSQSLPSLTTSRFDLNIEQTDSIKAQREMYQALRARKEALEETLRKKTEELKRLCFQEGELTGELPKETPLAPGEQIPTFRRRVGTSFSLSAKAVSGTDEREDQLAKMELEYELQSKITSAAHKLAQDKAVGKNVRKQRRQSYNRALQKLKDMEKKLNEMKRMAGKVGLRAASSTYDAQSEDSLPLTDSDSEIVSPAQSPPVQRYQREQPAQPAQRPQGNVIERPPISSQSFHQQQRPPDEDNLVPPQPIPHSVTLSPSHSSNQSEYDNMKHAGRLEGSLDSGFSSANNMYNINSQRTSHYESTDHLKTTANPNYQGDGVLDDRLNLPSKHGSLDGAYRKAQQKYNSLERNTRQEHPGNDPNLPELTPSRFGSKRESQTEYEYDPPSHRSSIMVEVPVHHEEHSGNRGDGQTYYSEKHFWQEAAPTDPSPIVRSPEPERKDNAGRSESPHVDQCYSPRGFEGSYTRSERYVYPAPSDQSGNARVRESQPSPQSSSLVTVTRLQPHMEVSKPYEMADFYKYSERLRRQRLIEHYQRQLIGTERISRASTPSQHSTDSGNIDETSHHSGSSQFQSSSNLVHPSSPYRACTPQSPTYSTTSSVSVGHAPVMYGQQQQQQQQQHPGGGDHPQYGGTREVTSSFQTVKSHGPGVQYVQSMSFRAQQIQSAAAAQHKVYQPLQRMKCEPIKKTFNPSNSTLSSSSASSSQPPASGEGVKPSSSFSLDRGESLAEAFSEEMLAWYDDREAKPATLV